MSLDLNKEVIEEIRARCDIVEVISSYGVQLKRSGGSSFKGLCPFHQEKTPSFHVDVARQAFHCFGCGKGGDVFRFFMDKENVDFLNAAQILAARCGVVIPEKNSADAGRDNARRSERDRLFAINEEFSKFFCRYLADNPHSPAAEYLQKRKIPRDVAEKFRIGAAPDSWSACRDFGRSLGFSDEELLLSGIVRKKEDTGNVYDQFKGRLTFTIENEQGRAVGFSARTLEPKPQDGRKYVNTPETPVFRKGWLLYALPQARQGIGRYKQAILCEGQLDAIAFHRAGFDCAVAPLGTAFTPDQARIIRRYARKVILAFDADGAGRKAVLRAAEILLPLSVDLRVLRIPGGKDPDELYANGGAGAVEAALKSTVSWLDVLGEALLEKFELDSPVGRSQAAAYVAGFIKLVADPVEAEVYTEAAAKLLHVTPGSMAAEINAAAKTVFRPAPVQTVPNPVMPQKKDAAFTALLTLFELAFSSADCGRQISELLQPEELEGSTPIHKALNLAIGAALNDELDELPKAIADLLIETPSDEISRVLVKPTTFANPQKAITDAVADLHWIRKISQKNILLEQLRSCEDGMEKLRLLTEIQKLAQP